MRVTSNLTSFCKNRKSFKYYNGFVQNLVTVTQIHQGLNLVQVCTCQYKMFRVMIFYGTQCSVELVHTCTYVSWLWWVETEMTVVYVIYHNLIFIDTFHVLQFFCPHCLHVSIKQGILSVKMQQQQPFQM